ncbi:MAG TPA: tetratricopeptide repeat protein [Pyrinomonadaceae bacterium]|jgi:tetratricopeptide (TPR) repeat protein|nr:tetratricopeptide repeat protein [Pyrinomonadaceae bacterium]
MNRENVLFSIIGVGFGLFFGFGFASWANMRAAATLVGDGRAVQSALPSNGVADQQRLETAAQAAVKAARENSSDYEAQMGAARASFQTERFDDVLEFLLRANTLKPDELEPVVALGNVNYDTGNYLAAEKWYTAALAKQPDDINVRTDLGLTFLLRTPPDNERALAEFRRSLEIDPRHEPTLQNMVVALTRKGDKAEARAMLAKLESLNPKNPALSQLRTGIDASSPAEKTPANGKS